MNLQEINKHIGRNIRKARSQLGFSQAEVAKSIGVTYQQIQKYEAGNDAVSAGKLLIMARFLGKPIIFFYDLKLNDSDIVSARDTKEIIRLSRAWMLLKGKKPRKDLLYLIESMGGSDNVH